MANNGKVALDWMIVGEALPGFEHCDEERAAVVAAETGEGLTAELARVKGNIDRKAGNIETLSPLFRGKGPQGELF